MSNTPKNIVVLAATAVLLAVAAAAGLMLGD